MKLFVMKRVGVIIALVIVFLAFTLHTGYIESSRYFSNGGLLVEYHRDLTFVGNWIWRWKGIYVTEELRLVRWGEHCQKENITCTHYDGFFKWEIKNEKRSQRVD